MHTNRTPRHADPHQTVASLDGEECAALEARMRPTFGPGLGRHAASLHGDPAEATYQKAREYFLHGQIA